MGSIWDHYSVDGDAGDSAVGGSVCRYLRRMATDGNYYQLRDWKRHVLVRWQRASDEAQPCRRGFERVKARWFDCRLWGDFAQY